MVFSPKQQKTCDKWIVGLKCRFDSKRDGLKLSCTLGKAKKIKMKKNTQWSSVTREVVIKTF